MHLGFGLDVAFVTLLGLRGRVEHRIACRVTDMAVGAGNFVAGVRTIVPSKTHVTLVAGQAHRVLLLDRRRVVAGKGDDRRPLLAAAHPARVRIARAVAGLTLQLAVAKRPT